ncbi:hypothetical protein REMIM1_CH01831 [Rhizobium etli bv. mimosae str. Mim1]|nr:hypothetical protein REMIM1_CH01831 [Rhizobium etli bv. mimosae str. Mim1]
MHECSPPQANGPPLLCFCCAYWDRKDSIPIFPVQLQINIVDSAVKPDLLALSTIVAAVLFTMRENENPTSSGGTPCGG